MPKPASATGRRTARYEKLCATIERRQRKLDRDQRSVERGVKALAKLEQQRRRLRKAIDKAERKAADTTVKTVAAPPPAVTLAELGETEIGRANAESWNTIPAVAKAKRKRKPKASPVAGEAQASELQAFADIAVDRAARMAARMEAAGFRKTSRRR